MNNEVAKRYEKYILVTPCKNEGDNIPHLIKSVVKQTIKPEVWAIVDDGSTDNTPEILREAKEKYDWIHPIRLEESKRDLGLHYSIIVDMGFNHCISHCEERGLEYKYLGLLDGDLILEYTYFENLIREFTKDSKLGIAGGNTKHIIGDRIRYAKVNVNEPSGGHMLIRKECFFDCGGFPQVSYASDSVLKAKARLRGWKTRRFTANIVTEIRDVSSAEGYWNGFIHKGESSYYLNHNPLHVLMRVIRYSFKRPYYIGIAYLVGYLSSIIQRKERIKDIEVRSYFWNKWKETSKNKLGISK